MNVRTFLRLAIVAVFFTASSACHAQNPELHRITTIHVADMGSGDQSARFHSLLQDALRTNGFQIAETPETADATLTGSFSHEAKGNFTSARVTVQLKSRNGKLTIWSGDYISQHKGEGHEDVIKTLADSCAERFRKDWEKSGK